MGQFVNKAYRINHQIVPFLLRDHFTHRRIQRGKKLILRINIRLTERVQKCGFPHIGIAYQRYGGNLLFRAFFSHQLSSGGNFFQSRLQIVNSSGNMPLVCGQLAFPGASGADAAAQPRKLNTAACQSGQPVLLLGKLYL